MNAEVRTRNGRMELLVGGIVLAVEGGFLHDPQLLALYNATMPDDGIPGTGRYWTPALLKLAATRINAGDSEQPNEQQMVEELRKVYPKRSK